jgi:hypothetical protein
MIPLLPYYMLAKACLVGPIAFSIAAALIAACALAADARCPREPMPKISASERVALAR